MQGLYYILFNTLHAFITGVMNVPKTLIVNTHARAITKSQLLFSSICEAKRDFLSN